MGSLCPLRRFCQDVCTGFIAPPKTSKRCVSPLGCGGGRWTGASLVATDGCDLFCQRACDGTWSSDLRCVLLPCHEFLGAVESVFGTYCHGAAGMLAFAALLVPVCACGAGRFCHDGRCPGIVDTSCPWWVFAELLLFRFCHEGRLAPE